MAASKLGALMIGTGEYTTGYTGAGASASDKKIGVIALAMFDLRRRGKIGRIVMVGSNGTRMPAIRQHLTDKIAHVYKDMDVSFDSFPADTVASDPRAYLTAIDSMNPGDLCTIFTPDDTHYDIALAAVNKGLHVLVTKPAVKTMAEHRSLRDAAASQGVLVTVEVHKRWDPIYRDARDRIVSALGNFSFMQAYMSQPKLQLRTFASWAGKSSDISYYLNSHHVDFHVWAANGNARPVRVVAMASTGTAKSEPINIDTEDTITLSVQWENIRTKTLGHAVYTSSWIAPKADVHSQQRFFYMGSNGEVTIDQAHRGYSVATDSAGYASVNPLFMKYTPSAEGYFVGQQGYGYQSIECFADEAIRLNAGGPALRHEMLATIGTTLPVTAILEAGRRSLDSGRGVKINYDTDTSTDPVDLILE